MMANSLSDKSEKSILKFDEDDDGDPLRYLNSHNAIPKFPPQPVPGGNGAPLRYYAIPTSIPARVPGGNEEPDKSEKSILKFDEDDDGDPLRYLNSHNAIPTFTPQPVPGGNEEPDCFTPSEESRSDSVENINLSNETGQFAEALTESVDEWRRHVSELEKGIHCEMEVYEYPRGRDAADVGDSSLVFQGIVRNQKYRHVKSETTVKLIRGYELPAGTAAIAINQYTRMNENSFWYESDGIIHRCDSEFEISDLDYLETTDLHGFVVDSLKSGRLFYEAISAEELNLERSRVFSDEPSIQTDKEIVKMFKRQEFYSFITMQMISGNEIREIPIKCWKWGFQFDYDKQARRETHEITLSEMTGEAMLEVFGNLRRICKGDNANKRLKRHNISMLDLFNTDGYRSTEKRRI